MSIHVLTRHLSNTGGFFGCEKKIQLTGRASHVSIVNGSSEQNLGSAGCNEGGRGGGGSRNSGGGPGHSQSAAASMTSHIVGSSGLGVSSP